MKFRKLPIEIEAHRWYKNGDHPKDGESGTEGEIIRYFRHPKIHDGELCDQCGVRMIQHGWIDTPEGGHRVCPGDWIITGVMGERYPCKDRIFRVTYESVDGEDF